MADEELRIKGGRLGVLGENVSEVFKIEPLEASFSLKKEAADSLYNPPPLTVQAYDHYLG